MGKLMKLTKRIVLLLVLLLIVGLGYFGYKIRQNVQQVTTYEAEVEQAVKENNIPEYKNLVLAIIYTESKGRTEDLMQSSESAYGKRQMIGTTKESIDAGVAFLAQSINQANEAGCDIWTAVQAYNFGLDYISFVKERGGKNSIRLAEEYSKEVLSPLLGNTEQKTYRYYRPQALVYNGGFLYSNGGNMFYADIVRMNEQFIKWLK
ncbi:transglycosylase SLT domain protein [Enterococcus plantarum]|uniref:Lysozyme family protein n=1 Tax=Enterococcus plantarum TaxID=1077675 RepID=A0A2W3ZI89_9ENTE|nr:lysozyme family protein [Enterococcus plantarum]MBO0421787.1 lysozyme family protein [Enterococcus plantarum]MBO0468373.1 lysozyme family protein [Enterococcus plantarum]OEG21013.1 transglycosylase SLT domain protein [Enterococcus plantarum]PZL76207.1 lysozyme family protein [Enterococcus plantarum]